MSRAVAGDSLKRDHGAVGGGHLRNHVHLTNCIHMKNHILRRTPDNLAEKSLLRDLVVLQRSKSLRDPSTSPPLSWRRNRSNEIAVARNRSRSNSRLDGDCKGEDELGKSEHRTTAGQAGNHNEINVSRGKKRRFRRARKDLGSANLAVAAARSTVSFNSSSQEGGVWQRCHVGEGREEDAELEVSQASRNVCGIPWSWSRIHHRGKSFLGMSDSRTKRSEGSALQSQGNGSNLLVAPSPVSPSSSSESEVLPLLAEGLGTQDSRGNPHSVLDYSREIGRFSHQSSTYAYDSDLASEVKPCNLQKSKRRQHGRHKNLTQKYMPKTFKDLVGQNLVVQALSNAVLRKKVGLVYVFYGPHGTGKSSCARVFAKALNCQSVEHPKPCDMCTSCISYNLGKSRNVLEVGSVSNVDFERIVDILNNVLSSPLESQYRVCIIDDCDIFPAGAWSVISKVFDRAPHHVVFVLVSSNLELPHTIISRCQKFFFPKLKEYDIFETLTWISNSEGLEVDKDALRLIASRSDGSLRDAEMTLDQLSLLGQRISLSLVQELVGVVSDEKLVDLLDLALSADTANTVKSLREITETGIEPVALMSQLATIITDILAGSYVFMRERLHRKFFCQPTLSKEDMEKLRQALKTLSEAEKQLRVSNDKLTWLTAALLQLAPDQQYMLPGSSSDTSLNLNPPPLGNCSERDVPKGSTSEEDEMGISNQGLSRVLDQANHGFKCGNNLMCCNNKMLSTHSSGSELSKHAPNSLTLSKRATKQSGGYYYDKSHMDRERIWQAVLESIQSNTLRQFLTQGAKLTLVTLGAAPTVQLLFSLHVNKSKAEKFRGQILEAFESVLSSSVILEIRYESVEDVTTDSQVPVILPSAENDSSQMTLRRSLTNCRSRYSQHGNLDRRLSKEYCTKGITSSQARWLQSDPHILTEGEIIARRPFHQEHQHSELDHGSTEARVKGNYSAWVEDSSSQSQAEGCLQRRGRSRRKTISISEKLEQKNLRLEPISRSILCWKASKRIQGKLSGIRIKILKSHSLSKIVPCGRCLSTRSPG
ncbi:protein STICHEL-like 4 [Typha angustifolia]|uniref:protein STICHEL-like 4 n=1 Tax=Typha angustifolia TaxID=59011 RepID=UPI003C30A40F